MNDSQTGPRVLDVPRDWTLPKLGKRVVPPGGVVRTEQSDESVTDYDTADADLAGLGVSLQRATLWTLRVEGNATDYPLAGRGIPVDVRDLLLGMRGGLPLRVSARAQVSRVVHRVSDAADVELGTITEVVRSASGSYVRWVEVAGWDDFADAAVRRLVKSDAVERGVLDTDTADRTVGSMLLGYLREQRHAVLHADLRLRREKDSVHAFRVAIRRIRSALRVVDVTDDAQRTALDDELRWLSQVLGAVRDLEVLREHLIASFDAVPGAESARAVVFAALDADETAAWATLIRTLAGRRYLTLLRTLRDWCEAPPFTAAAAEPEHRLARYVKAAKQSFEKKLRKAGDSADKLHGARKAAKRARYVASFAGAAAGKHGAAVVKRAKSLQTALGDHQDTVLAADYVARVGASASGGAAFGCGVVWAHEHDRAHAILRRVVD